MILQETDLFKDVDPGIMKEIADICSEENYAKDTVLFKRGDEADCLYILEKGSIRLVIENGGNITFGLYDPGEVFGWSSMVESGHYTATCTCATESKVLKIEEDGLAKIFNRHPEAGFKVLKRLAGVISRRLIQAYQDFLSATGQDTTPSYG